VDTTAWDRSEVRGGNINDVPPQSDKLCVGHVQSYGFFPHYTAPFLSRLLMSDTPAILTFSPRDGFAISQVRIPGPAPGDYRPEFLQRRDPRPFVMGSSTPAGATAGMDLALDMVVFNDR
jgi:hypothetical protein